MNAVDTNVYVYALDADEAAKQAKALELFDRLALNRADTVLVWQVATEFLNQLRRWESQKRLTATEVEAAFNALVPYSRCAFPVSPSFKFRLTCAPASAFRTGTPCCLPPARKPASPRFTRKIWMPELTMAV